MQLILEGFSDAFDMIRSGEPLVFSAAWRSLWISSLAVALATLLGLPLGTWLARARFRGNALVVLAFRAGIALPTVFVGMICYAMFSRRGPLGPLELLLRDPSISDILINGPKTVYVERTGRLERSDVCFRDDDHLIEICQRIAGRIGRRLDASSPMVDARLEDGSRVNAVIRPLALDGALVSIRRFPERPLMASDLIDETVQRANTFFENQGLGVVRQPFEAWLSTSGFLGASTPSSSPRWSSTSSRPRSGSPKAAGS